MSGKFTYKSKFCYAVAILIISELFSYCRHITYFDIIMSLLTITLFFYCCNFKGTIETFEDERFQINGFFINDIYYKDIKEITVDRIYVKDITGVYDKNRIKKLRLRIETDEKIITFDAKLKYHFNVNTEEAEQHCFCQLYDYVNQQTDIQKKQKSVDMMKSA